MEIKIFQKPEFGAIRTAGTAEEPLFCLADLCRVLEISNVTDTRKRLDPKGLDSIEVLTKGGKQSMYFVNEKNLYKVIMRSDKPQAEAFQDWVCGEVLPSIRKNGGYIHTTAEDTPETIMAKALLLADKTMKSQAEKIAQQAEKIEADAPKVLFADAVNASDTSILIGELAKLLKQNGVNIGQRRLFEWLRNNGYLMKGGSSYNTPTQKAMDLGLFTIKETVISHADGHITINKTSKVTGRGQIYFINKFNSDYAVRG